MKKLKVTIARTIDNKYAACTEQSPFFFFEHEDLQALCQQVNNTLNWIEEFGEQEYWADYYFTSKLLEFQRIDLGTKS